MNKYIYTILKKVQITSKSISYCLQKMTKKEIVDGDWQEAENKLLALNPRPDRGGGEAEHSLDPIYDLHIIVPCYNVEKTVESCIDSILNQKTSFSYLVTVVNDGSPDSTPEILRKYDGDPKVELIDQENRGISGARNRALEKIRGKYVMFVDSDDLLPDTAVENLLSAAFKKDADIVEGGYTMIDINGNTRRVVEYQREGFTTETGYSLRGLPWGKVVRSEFFRNLKFPEGFWFEDSIFAFCIFPFASAKYTIKPLVYRYLLNPSGITESSKSRPKSIDTVWLIFGLMKHLANHCSVIGVEEQKLLLEHIALNAQRVSGLTEEIQKDVFIYTRHMYEKYFLDASGEGLHGKYKNLHTALSDRNYFLYKSTSLYWNYLR